MKKKRFLYILTICLMFVFFIKPQTVKASETIVQGIAVPGKSVSKNYDDGGWDEVKKRECFYENEDLNFMLCAGSNVFVKSATLYIDGVEQITMQPNTENTFMRFCNSSSRKQIAVKPGKHTMQMKVDYAVEKVTNTTQTKWLEKTTFYVYETPYVNGPATQSVVENNQAKFTVTASGGTGKRTYQWYYATSSKGAGNAIAGSTSQTHTIKANDVIRSKNGRYYYCEVKDVCEHCGNVKRTVISSRAKLNVYYLPAVSKLSDVTVISGNTATFSIIASEGNPEAYNYQWYCAETSLKDDKGTAIEGATSASYSVTASSKNRGKYYYCEVSNKAGKINSNRAVLNVNNRVKYDANGGKNAPSAQTKTYGKTLTLRTTVPTRSGYVFQGWGLSKDTTTVSYKKGAKYTKNANVTLYAVWKKKQVITSSVKDETSIIYAKGKKVSLKAVTNGDGKLTYKTSNSKVASVSSKGLVTINGYGKVTITITAAGTSKCVSATKKIVITVKPKKMAIDGVSSPKKTQIKVTWKKDSTVSGYQVYVSPSATFARQTKKGTLTVGTTKMTLKNLQRNTRYYVKIRAYKTVNGTKYYGAWSDVESIKVK